VAAGPHVVVGVKDDLFAVGMPRAAASSFGGRFLIGWAKSRDSEGRNKEPTRRLWLLTLDWIGLQSPRSNSLQRVGHCFHSTAP